MKSYYKTDISTKNALKFDLVATILQNPQQPTISCRTEMWMPEAGGVWYFDSQEMFNKNWLAYANKEVGLDITEVLVFYRKAGYQHPSAHIDSALVGTSLQPVCAGYNWVLEHDPTAEMVWYEPWWNADDRLQAEAAVEGKIAHPTFKAELVNSGTMYYQETPVEYLTERERHSLSSDYLTICRTNIPHNVQAGAKDRWCMSLRTYPMLLNTWADYIK
tara:strand:+ start:3127 stop:3780 length:654 start_codon:yes stop_codon:yes gene_type:complete